LNESFQLDEEIERSRLSTNGRSVPFLHYRAAYRQRPGNRGLARPRDNRKQWEMTAKVEQYQPRSKRNCEGFTWSEDRPGSFS
jgi:hypothetical protein